MKPWIRNVLLLLLAAGFFILLVYLSVSETEESFRTCEILDFRQLDTVEFRNYDSVTVAASTLYEASALKILMQGRQYRKEWETPIRVPIVFLDTLYGGMRILEEGGGKQTHSLELLSNNGIVYTLRGVAKDPSTLVPEVAKSLGLENIVIDGISAQHPYGALPVAELSDASGILHTYPELIFVPTQKRLDTLNNKYGNRLYYLEYESEGEINWTKIDNVLKLVDTEKLQELKRDNHAISVDKDALVRARLFDLVVGDWDRHAGQWGWALKKKQDSIIATPVPTDRDNAFFDIDGVLPFLITNDAMLPEVQDYKEEIDNLEGLVSQFDEYFLRTAKSDQFIKQALYLKMKITDSAIIGAFKSWPKEIDNISGEAIRSKIRSRRDSLERYAKKFYEVLQRRAPDSIVLNGSEDLELPERLQSCFDCLD